MSEYERMQHLMDVLGKHFSGNHGLEVTYEVSASETVLTWLDDNYITKRVIELSKEDSTAYYESYVNDKIAGNWAFQTYENFLNWIIAYVLLWGHYNHSVDVWNIKPVDSLIEFLE